MHLAQHQGIIVACNIVDIGPAITSITLEVNNGFYAGIWGTMDYCDTATFAYGFNQLVDDTYWADSTSVNAIKLVCKSPISGHMSSAYPTSSTSQWGAWEGWTECPADYYIVEFQMFAQPSGHYDSDDSSTNNLRVKCRGPGLSGSNYFVREGDGYEYGGIWGDVSAECETGTAVCGIQTKVTPYLGIDEDDTALDDVKLQCCKLY